jgi:hypothetical protein
MQTGALFSPVVDVRRLEAASGVAEAKLREVLSLLGSKEADAGELKRVIKGAFDRELALFADPNRFWMVHSFVTRALELANIRAFLGTSTSYHVRSGQSAWHLWRACAWPLPTPPPRPPPTPPPSH